MRYQCSKQAEARLVENHFGAVTSEQLSAKAQFEQI